MAQNPEFKIEIVSFMQHQEPEFIAYAPHTAIINTPGEAPLIIPVYGVTPSTRQTILAWGDFYQEDRNDSKKRKFEPIDFASNKKLRLE